MVYVCMDGRKEGRNFRSWRVECLVVDKQISIQIPEVDGCIQTTPCMQR